MYNFKTFVKHIPDTCSIHVRISDNQLEEEDWGVSRLTIIDGVVAGQSRILDGAYWIPDMMGWTTDQLIKWSSYDATGRHPEQYNEISV